MGLRGPLPKPADRRQRRNKPSTPLVLRGDRRAPTAPKEFLATTREQWRVYWASDLAQAAREAHVPIVTRMFALYDERERSYRALRKQGRLTAGSQGQVVLNPLALYIAKCDAEIRQLEDRLGLNPRGMAALGGAFAKAQKSLDDLNQDVGDETNDSNGDQDPRVIAIG